MITQKVKIEGKEYEVSGATYKMLQESINQLHISIQNYNDAIKAEGISEPVAAALAPKPVPAKRTRKKS